MSAVDALSAARTFWRTFGAAGLGRRAAFEARRAAGLFRTHETRPAKGVASAPVPAAWPFMASESAMRDTFDLVAALTRANRVVGGEHQAYRHAWMPLPRTASDWHRHPMTKLAYDPRIPWFRIAHFDSERGDIKDTWEPARFGWAFDLGRAWLVSGNDDYSRAFWESFEVFMDANPPFSGVHWSCGQETAIRAIALIWAEGALMRAPSSNATRLGRLREALAVSAERIEDAIGYALSQRNNHGISEAAGLAVIGARLHGAEPRAERWLMAGHLLLDELVSEQFAEDGWYIQHSFNYTRLALDQLVVARLALRSAGLDLKPQSIARIRACLEMLGAVISPNDGTVPNHGANDGSYVLPLSLKPYQDFRPSLTAAAAAFGHPLPDSAACDSETLAWLGMAAPPTVGRSDPPGIVVGQSGWVSASAPRVRAFARAGSYSSRPGHIDPLHLDIWIDGKPVAIDAGTYRYAAPPPWNNGLSGIAVHNTVTLDDLSPARRGSRFLWLSWPYAEVVDARAADGGQAHVELLNRSWTSFGITHRRICRLSPGTAIVLDEVTGPPSLSEAVSVHWLVDGSQTELSVLTEQPSETVYAHGDPQSVDGWISDHYGSKRPATSIRVKGRLVNGRFRAISNFGDKLSLAELQSILRGDSMITCSV